MIIKSLELQNFRQYKGIQKIGFSIDTEKNVTVIKGENGAGKTTLLQAFVWCLYGKINLPNYEKLLTADIANNLKIGESSIVLVEINFIHNNKEYYVCRTNAFLKGLDGKLNRQLNECKLQRKKANGALEQLNENELEKIVPADLSRYFFFDGERIENISKSTRDGKKDLDEAIRNILGLNVVLNAKKHLEKVEKAFENDLNNENNNGLDKIKIEKENNEIALIEKQTNLNSTIEELDIIEKSLEDISNRLKEFEDIKVIEKERDEKLKRKKSKEEMIINIENDIKNINKKYFADFLGQKVLGLCKDKLDLNSLENKGIVGIDSVAIDELIKRGKCLCGQCLVNGSEELENLIKQKDFQPPASLGTIINQFNEKTHKLNSDAEEYKRDIKDKFRYLEESRTIVEELQDNLDVLSEKLIGIEKANALENERIELLLENGKNIQKRETLESEIKVIKDKIEILKIDIDKVASTDKDNEIILLRKSYTKRLLEEVEKFYCIKEQGIKTQLNNKIMELFSEMLCTNHKIEINDDYTFKVYDVDGEDSTSQGQDVITSFAFIGAIIYLAKEKHKEIEVEEPYPLIMDAPFAKLSKTHRRNVAKLLPNIAEQFILITVDSQYEGDIEDTLMNRIGKKYELVMNIEDGKYTEIERRG